MRPLAGTKLEFGVSLKHAETVTFGGSGLDRAAKVRSDPDAFNTARNDDRASAVVLWKGKVLVDASGVLRLSMKHPVIAEGPGGIIKEPVLLGVEDSGPVFGWDISAWVPEGQDTNTVGAFVDASQQTHPELPEGSYFAELRRQMTHLSPRDAELAATAKAIIGWHQTHKFCAACGHPSDIHDGGWQRKCPACGASHFPRTDPVVIMLITHGDKVLMGRSPGWPEGMFSLLAGFVEPGETIEAAVRREVFEEAGVHIGQVSYLSSQPWPFPASLMIGCQGDAVTTEINIDPDEIEEAMWVGRSEMMSAFAGDHPYIKPARPGSISSPCRKSGQDWRFHWTLSPIRWRHGCFCNR